MSQNAKAIHFGIPAQKRIVDGALLLSKTVATTYGPQGRTCILDRLPGLLATKDGVSVAREIQLEDPLQNLGSETLKAACIRVNEVVGDGTTTVAILAGAILQQGQKLIAGGMDPMQVTAGMRAAARFAQERVQDYSTAVSSQEGLNRVAFIASNRDEEIASLLAEACMAVGKDGAIIVEDGKRLQSILTFKEGMEINQGALSPQFLPQTGERVIEGPLVAVVNMTLTKLDQVKELMEVASQWPDNELILLALDVSGEALTTMVLNNSKGIVKCVALRAPGGAQREEYLKDIAALSGATFVDPVAGFDIQAWNPEWFGSFRQATIRGKSSVFTAYEESSETVEQRLAEIRGAETHCSSDYDRDRLRERRAKLTGGLAVLEVGGVTEAAMKERRARVEDALSAVQAALRTGIVAGGGAAYLTASLAIQEIEPEIQDAEFQAGWAAFARALQEPILKLAQNAGKTGATLIDRIVAARLEQTEPNIGWDAVQDQVRDLTQDPPVIDPTSVALSVIETATSVSTTLLTTGASITQIRKV